GAKLNLSYLASVVNGPIATRVNHLAMSNEEEPPVTGRHVNESGRLAALVDDSGFLRVWLSEPRAAVQKDRE
ncbi:hypothetical protein THAOC_27509, partial [Thalassiosira oceanica]